MYIPDKTWNPSLEKIYTCIIQPIKSIIQEHYTKYTIISSVMSNSFVKTSALKIKNSYSKDKESLIKVDSTDSESNSKDESQSDSEQGDVFEIELIVGDKIQKGKQYYRIKWKGYPYSDNTWEKEPNVIVVK